ncbi:MAG: hypothetical protein AAFN00_18750, partial [Cyanobacteria bacterium J06558_2]
CTERCTYRSNREGREVILSLDSTMLGKPQRASTSIEALRDSADSGGGCWVRIFFPNSVVL